jgi:DNA-binding NarL/FixJ family response regulator
VRPWPARDEDTSPAALVCRHPAAEPLSALKRRLRGPAVIALVDSEGESRTARASVVEGADCVLIEDQIERALIPALQAVQAGLIALSSELGPAIESPPLTPREKQVLALVVMGFSNKEIADQLVVSESTVKSHLFSAFRRLGVRTRSEATVLITDPERGFGSGILTIPRE